MSEKLSEASDEFITVFLPGDLKHSSTLLRGCVCFN